MKWLKEKFMELSSLVIPLAKGNLRVRNGIAMKTIPAPAVRLVC